MVTAAAISPDCPERLLRVEQVTKMLSMSRSAVYSLLDSGALRSVRLPGAGARFHRRVRPSDLADFINSGLTGGVQCAR